MVTTLLPSYEEVFGGKARELTDSRRPGKHSDLHRREPTQEIVSGVLACDEGSAASRLLAKPWRCRALDNAGRAI